DPSRKWMRIQVSAASPCAPTVVCPSSVSRGKIRSSAPRRSALLFKPGFHPAPKPPSSAPMPAPPRLFDRTLHRKRLDRAARGFAQADFLKRRAAQDVAGRLEPIMRNFSVAVDLAARTGAFREALAESEAAGRVGLLI